MHCHWGRNVRPQFLQASKAFVLKSLKAWKKRKKILVIDFCKFVHNNKHNYVITLHYYLKKLSCLRKRKIFVLTCFWAKFFIKYFTFTPRLEQLACPNLSFNAIDIHLDTQTGSHKVSFLCWYLCFFSQSPEVVNFQGVSLCHFAKKSCIRTLNSIIETKLGQNFAQK